MHKLLTSVTRQTTAMDSQRIADPDRLPVPDPLVHLYLLKSYVQLSKQNLYDVNNMKVDKLK